MAPIIMLLQTENWLRVFTNQILIIDIFGKKTAGSLQDGRQLTDIGIISKKQMAFVMITVF